MDRTAQDPVITSGSGPDRARRADGLWSQYLRSLLAAATYRPERHYMRGRPADLSAGDAPAGPHSSR